MTYPYADCCPNLPTTDPGCDDGWCCTHETRHDEQPEPDWSERKQALDPDEFRRETLGTWPAEQPDHPDYREDWRP